MFNLSPFFIRYLIRVIIAVFALGAALTAGYLFTPPLTYDFSWHTLLFFFLLTVLVALFTARGLAGGKTGTFLGVFTAGMVFKLFVSVLYFAWQVKHLEQRIPFLVSFAVFYIVFTVLEVDFLVRLSRVGGDKPKDNK